MPMNSTTACCHPDYLRQIIRVALQPMELWSHAAEEILLMTAAHESHLGRYLEQIRGPARGLYQMEPNTLYDIWDNYLHYRPEVSEQINHLTGIDGPDLGHLQYNPIYSTVMARLHNRRAPGALPEPYDVDGMAEYAKEYYNTPAGKATMEQYAVDYSRFVLV